MRSLKLSAVVLATVIQSCSQNSNNESSLKPSRIVNQSNDPAQDECQDRMKRFLSWYLANSHEIDSINSIINYPESFIIKFKLSRENISKTKYYELNRKKLDNYINSLAKSSFFSNFYLQRKKDEILSREAVLLAAKQEDGPAEGFEFDEVFTTQEMYEPEHIQNLKPIPSVKGAYALPVMENYGWILYTKMENGKCVIDSVGSLNSD